MKVKAIIEQGADGLFSVYMKDADLSFGLNGQGVSVREAKTEFLAAYEDIKSLYAEQGKPIETLVFEYEWDMPSFFNYFDWLNMSAVAKRAGVNPSLMRYYKGKEAYISEPQTKKIEQTLQRLGRELADLRL